LRKGSVLCCCGTLAAYIRLRLYWYWRPCSQNMPGCTVVRIDNSSVHAITYAGQLQ
jgi:hypothetical protein